MDRYDVTVVVYLGPSTFVDLSAAVSRPISITNGRSEITSTVGKCYGSATFLKDKVQEIIAEEIIALGFVDIDFGSRIRIFIDNDPIMQLFDGRITDITSGAEEISFSFVEEKQFDATRGNLFSWDGYKADGDFLFFWLFFIWLNTVGGEELYISTAQPNYLAIIHPEDGSTSNPFSYFEQILEGVPGAFFFHNPYYPSWELNFRTVSDIADLGAFVIGEEQILRNYDIQRSISDVANNVRVNYYNPVSNDYDLIETRVNNTSAAVIGQRKLNVESIAGADYASQLTAWTLGNRSPVGYPVVEFSTSVELLLKSPTAAGEDYVDLQYWLIPSRILDTSALNGVYEGFADHCFIEQITQRIDRSSWTLDFVVSALGYTALPQSWDEVPTAISWEDATGVYPDVITWDALLYKPLGV
jgi:hypothetical protein